MKKKIQLLCYLVLGLFPATTFAANAIGNIDNPGLPSTGINGQPLTIYGTVLGLIEIVLGIVGLIAVGFIIYGGFLYITSRGDDKVAGKGKQTLTNAVIGLLIVIFSYAIVQIVVNTAFAGKIR